MPNGGVPFIMQLTPGDGSPYLVHCYYAGVSLYAQKGRYEEAMAPFPGLPRRGLALPLMTLTAEEASALAWFVAHWLGEENLRPGYAMRNAEFGP